MFNPSLVRLILTIALLSPATLFTEGVDAQDSDEYVVPEDRCSEFTNMNKNSMNMDDPAVRALQQDCLYQAKTASEEPLIESTDIPDYSEPEQKPELEKIEPVELED